MSTPTPTPAPPPASSAVGVGSSYVGSAPPPHIPHAQAAPRRRPVHALFARVAAARPC
ncbi:hypothetical protein [Frondihabitans sp. PAMC 28766]|uniref:hypothetical protein n=1 Tax=Frondihabitans sp. PAMC 28766 TaxID=1795630 RepID=UPI0012FF60D1|nr:hypothetical protein [Frondihabitans sp. PAMC 28766]